MIYLEKEIKKELGYYVYALIDPRYHEVFYIGKGHNNRIKIHEKYAMKIDKDTPKLNRIREIKDAGKDVLEYIIVAGLDEKTAMLIEASFLELLKNKYQFDLKNKIKGCEKNAVFDLLFKKEELEKKLTKIKNKRN